MWFSKKKQQNSSNEIDLQANYYRRNFSRRDRKRKLKLEPEFITKIIEDGPLSIQGDYQPKVKNASYEALQKSLRFSFSDLFRNTKQSVEDGVSEKLADFDGSDKENSSPPPLIENLFDGNSSLQRSEVLIVGKPARKKTMKERVRDAKLTLVVDDHKEDPHNDKLSLRERLFGTKKVNIVTSNRKPETPDSSSTPALSSSVYEVQETLTQRYMSREDGYERLLEDLDAIPFDLTLKEQEKTFHQKLSDVIQNFSPKKSGYWEDDRCENSDLISMRFKSREQLEASLEVESCNPYDVAKRVSQAVNSDSDMEMIQAESQVEAKPNFEDELGKSITKESLFSTIKRKFSKRDHHEENPLMELREPVPTSQSADEAGIYSDIFDTRSVFLRTPSAALHPNPKSATTLETLHAEVNHKVKSNENLVEKGLKQGVDIAFTGSTKISTGISAKILGEAQHDHSESKLGYNDSDNDSMNSTSTTIRRSSGPSPTLRKTKEQMVYHRLVLNPTAIHFDTNIQDIASETYCYGHEDNCFNQNKYTQDFYRSPYGNKRLKRSSTTKSKSHFCEASQTENFKTIDLRRAKSTMSTTNNSLSSRMATRDTDRSIFECARRGDRIQTSFTGFTSSNPNLFDFEVMAKKLESPVTERPKSIAILDYDADQHADALVRTKMADPGKNADSTLTYMKRKELEELRNQINRNRMVNHKYLNGKNT